MPEEVLWGSFFDVEGILDRLGCRAIEGDILEFGCGYGTFTIPAAQRFKGNGRLFGLDIEPEMVDATEKRAREANLSNVITEVRDFVVDGTGRPSKSIGYALLFNILHIENPILLLREAYRILTPEGLLGIIHWRNDIETPRGPTLEIRPSPQQCRKWAESVGFEFVHEESPSCCPWHWGLVMRRPSLSEKA